MFRVSTATSVYAMKTLAVPAGGTVEDVFEFERVEPGEVLIVTGQTAASTTDLVVSLEGFEDI